jgi:hypothetical protein
VGEGRRGSSVHHRGTEDTETGSGARPHSAFSVASVPLWLSFFLLLLSACRSEPDTPEAQIRALVAKAEKAAEDKDIGTLKGLISERYAGAGGEKKRELVAVVGYNLLRHKSIHLLTQIRDIEFREPSRAEVVVFVAMAGQMIEGLADLARLRADIYRVDFAAAEESKGDWKVTRAAWRPAQIEDLS